MEILEINKFDPEKLIWCSDQDEKIKLKLIESVYPCDYSYCEVDIPSFAECWQIKPDDFLIEKNTQLLYVLKIERYVKPEARVGFCDWQGKPHYEIIKVNE